MRTAGTASRIESPAESLFGYLEIVLVQWKHRYFLVDIFYRVIDYIHTIALAAREGTLRRGKEVAGGGEYYLNKGRIRRIGGRGQLVKRWSTGIWFLYPCKFLCKRERMTA